MHANIICVRMTLRHPCIVTLASAQVPGTIKTRAAWTAVRKYLPRHTAHRVSDSNSFRCTGIVLQHAKSILQGMQSTHRPSQEGHYRPLWFQIRYQVWQLAAELHLHVCRRALRMSLT